MSSVLEIEKDIKQKQREIADLMQALEDKLNQSPDKALAEEMHDVLCTWNHTDGCGWFYEFKNKKPLWSGNAHQQYLKKAHTLAFKCKERGIEPETALSIFKMVKAIR